MIGIDICNISRFSKMGNLDKFLEKYFTENERKYILKSGNRFETIAGIFSAKEAFVKALGTGFGSVKPSFVEVLHHDGGQPYIKFNFEDKIKIKKVGLSISHDGDYAISVVNIEFFKEISNISKEYFELLTKRDLDGHKGIFGKVGIIGGSVGMCGSVDLNAKASLRMGSGLVYNICPKTISEILQIKAVENIILPVEDFENGFFVKGSIEEILNRIDGLDALAIGCGMGKREDNISIIGEILNKFEKPIIFDGDGIFYLKYFKDILKDRENIILTPHIKEFSDFSDIDLDEILSDKISILNKYFSGFKSTFLIKGKNTIIYSKGKYVMNTTGNNGMATAGSGDVLTGIILSLLGQGLNSFDAGKLGAYLHGLSGDLAVEELTEYSLIASDLIRFLPNAIKLLRGDF